MLKSQQGSTRKIFVSVCYVSVLCVVSVLMRKIVTGSDYGEGMMELSALTRK